MPSSDEVTIPAGHGRHTAGDLVVPEAARGLVVFAHGSGSSRHSPRNRQVATALQRRALATLLLDLLTAEEERQRANVFDIELLATRLVAATAWASERPQLAPAARWLLRRKHRRRCGPMGGGRARRARPRGRVPRWPAGPDG